MENTKEPTRNYWIISSQHGRAVPLSGRFYRLPNDTTGGAVVLDASSQDALKGFLQEAFCSRDPNVGAARDYLSRLYFLSNVVIQPGAPYPYRSFRWYFRAPVVSDDLSVLSIFRQRTDLEPAL